MLCMVEAVMLADMLAVMLADMQPGILVVDSLPVLALWSRGDSYAEDLRSGP